MENNENEWILVGEKKLQSSKNPKNPINKAKQQTLIKEDHILESKYTIPKKIESQRNIKISKIIGPNSSKNANVSLYQKKIEKNAEGEDELSTRKIYPEEFRKKLISKRTQLGLTQKDFACKLNVKERLIKGIENRTENFDPAEMAKLNNELNRLN